MPIKLTHLLIQTNADIGKTMAAMLTFVKVTQDVAAKTNLIPIVFSLKKI